MEKLKSILGDDLISIIKYKTGFQESYLFILKKINIKILDKIKEEYKNNYLFLTENSIKDGTDVFPLEFYNMKTEHEVLFGEDIVADLKFNKEHIRRELEFEFRSKLIHLRQEYLATKEKDLQTLIISAIPALTPMLKGMAFLKKINVDEDDLITKIGKAFDEDISVLKMISEKKEKNEKIKDEKTIIRKLMELLQNLSEKLDKLR